VLTAKFVGQITLYIIPCRMESCQALQGFLLNQNPDYVARIAVVSPAGSLLTLAPALSAHRYLFRTN
jgi:hypothetical protein